MSVSPSKSNENVIQLDNAVREEMGDRCRRQDIKT
jgi:hypothetical protein